MGTELIKASSGLDVSINYPDTLPAILIRTLVTPTVVQAVAELANTGVIVTSTVVEAIELTKIKIAYYQEHGRVIKEDIIPIIAKAVGIQEGRQIIDGLEQWGLDADLVQKARDQLEKLK